jgi:hypothetical protein
MSFILGIISAICFAIVVGIVAALYFASKRLPLVGLGIIKASGTDTAVTGVVEGVGVHGVKGFLKLLITFAFWKALVISFFKNTKSEAYSLVKYMLISVISGAGLFLTSLITGFIQIMIWIF